MRPLLLLGFLFLATTLEAQVATPQMGDFPPLRVQAIVGTGRKPVEGSSFKKTMQITPKLVVEGASSMLPIPAAEATMLTISMDTRAKYVQGKELYTVASAETVQIPAAANGARREFDFVPPVLTFDADRDHTNVGGQVFKFFICGLRDPKTKTLIFFQTTNAQLESFCRANPGRRDEFLKMAKGATFPAAFK